MKFEIILAFFLDLIFGDPKWFPHPVKTVEKAIEKYEIFVRKRISNPLGLRLAGIFLMFILCLFVYFLVLILLKLTEIFGQTVRFALEAIFIYFAISIKSLAQEAAKVLKALNKKNLILARKRLSDIVSRDTDMLSEQEVVRATVETVAENSVDGVISPLLYAFLGGAPLVWVYKTVNTADSMIGYKNERYIDFGWAAAKLDDILNFIPARLSVIFITIASFILGFSAKKAITVGFKEGKNNPSPNAGFPQAAFAGALEIRLGGLNIYQGVKVPKPFLGLPLKPLSKDKIQPAVKLMGASSFVTLVFILLLLSLFTFGLSF